MGALLLAAIALLAPPVGLAALRRLPRPCLIAACLAMRSVALDPVLFIKFAASSCRQINKGGCKSGREWSWRGCRGRTRFKECSEY